jgi:hypothetical protein
VNSIQHRAQRGFAYFAGRLANCRQRHGQQAGIGNIVYAHQTNIFWYSHFTRSKDVHQLAGQPVV